MITRSNQDGGVSERIGKEVWNPNIGIMAFSEGTKVQDGRPNKCEKGKTILRGKKMGKRCIYGDNGKTGGGGIHEQKNAGGGGGGCPSFGKKGRKKLE